MATTTQNYGLKKPAPDDFYTIEDQNSNMDILDTELKRVEDNFIVGTITISNSGWVEDVDSGFYRLAIPNAKVTENAVVDVNLDLVSLPIAEDCMLKGVTTSYNGGFYLYAETVPTSKMTGTMVIGKGVTEDE